jgi:ferredoxin
MIKVEVNWDYCESNAVCVLEAPDVFSIDDDDCLQINEANLTPERLESLHAAARRCPRVALKIIS